MQKRENFIGFGTRIFAGIGIVVVLALIIWGAVNVARLIPQAVSNLATAAITLTSVFTPQDSGLSLTVENEVIQSETPFDLTWTHNGSEEDSAYVFSYGCRDGVSIEVLDTEGVYNPADCETTTTLPSGSQVKMVAISEVNRFVDLPIAVAYANLDGTVLATDELTVTIVNDSVESSGTGGDTVITETNDNTSTTGSTGTTGGTSEGSGTIQGEEEEQLFEITGTGGGFTSDPNGFVDFAGRVLEVGIIDRATNEFIATSSASTKDRVAIRFEVENIGTKTSEGWTFVAVLPTKRIYFFNPETTQRPLAPGDRIEYTIGFDGVKVAEEAITTINIDNGNTVGEPNEDNNIVRASIKTFVQPN